MSKERQPLAMFEEFNPEETVIYNKAYMFIKGFAIAKNYKANNSKGQMHNTLSALALCRMLHSGQKRKDGVPYVMHPLKVCTTLISYGIEDDVILAAALLHDVLEDCQDKLPLSGKELISEYGIDPEVLEIVTLLSKQSGLNDYELSLYFDKIKKNPKALLVKLADRLHNSCTLYTFTPEKMRKYIRETNMFLIPMASYGKAYYPQYTNALSILKSNIYSLNHSMEVICNNYDNHMKELESKVEEKDREIEELKKQLELLKQN